MTLLYVLTWIILCVLVGFIGGKRKIGFAGAFALSIILSPLIGIIITAFSKDLEEEKYKNKTLATQRQQNKTLEKLLVDNKKNNHNDNKIISEKSIELEKSINKQKEKLSYLESKTTKSILSEEDIENKKNSISEEVSKLSNKLIRINVEQELSDEINELDKLLDIEIIDKEEYSNRKEILIQNRLNENKFEIIDTEKINIFKYGGHIEKNRIKMLNGLSGNIYTNPKKNKQASFISKNQNGIESMNYYVDIYSCIKAFKIYHETGNVSQKGFVKRK